MNIGIYVPFWPAGTGYNGIVTYASQLIPALRRLGHTVFIVTPERLAGENTYTIDLQSFVPGPTLLNRAMFKLVPETAAFHSASRSIVSAVHNLVEEHELDVFEIEETLGLSAMAARSKLAPIVVRLHGPWFLNGRFSDPDDQLPINRRREEWEGKGIRYSHLVTAPAASVLQAVKTHYRLNLPTSRVIPNPMEVRSETETWNIKTCRRDSLLFVGRFDRRKGGDLILQAFAKLAASNPRLELTFVGPDKGITGPNGARSSFDAFARSSIPDSYLSRIHFRGQLSHTEVMALRSKHFITVIASQYEILPYSVLEAMSFGCPIVATAVGGIPELLHDGKNGLLVPSQNVDAMATACSRLLDDPENAALLGHQAWLDCQSLYRPDNVARQTLAAYEEAIAGFRATQQ